MIEEYFIKSEKPQELYKKIIETVPVMPKTASLTFEDSRIEYPDADSESIEKYIKACEQLDITPFYNSEIIIQNSTLDFSAEILVPSCMQIIPIPTELPIPIKSLLCGGKPYLLGFKIAGEKGYQKFQTAIWPLIADNSQLTIGSYLDFCVFERRTNTTLELPSLYHPNNSAYLRIDRNDQLNQDQISALEKWVEDFQRDNLATVEKIVTPKL